MPARPRGAHRAPDHRPVLVPLPQGEEISERLAAFDRDPATIDVFVNSHFQFDHVGDNALVPNAIMVVQRREWEAALDPDIAVRHGCNRADFDIAYKVAQVDGEHDLFGDGSVLCLPIHGHTPGHHSLKLRLDSGDVVLAADACYFCQTLRERQLPQRVHDRDAMRASLDKVAQLEAVGARIFFGHDAAFLETVPQAPAAIV